MTRLQQPDQRTQAGMLLLPNGVVPQRIELPVPCPPAPPALPDPADYAHLLPGVAAGGLRAWVAPATAKLGFPVAIIADPRKMDADLNGQAVFLTVDLQTGFGEQTRGAALALCAEPGRHLTDEEYDALDDVLRGPLMDCYENGLTGPPSDDMWSALAFTFERGAERRRAGKERHGEPPKTCRECGAAEPSSRCGRCHQVHYCNQACQRANWRHHKHACAALAAAHGGAQQA